MAILKLDMPTYWNWKDPQGSAVKVWVERKAAMDTLAAMHFRTPLYGDALKSAICRASIVGDSVGLVRNDRGHHRFFTVQLTQAEMDSLGPNDGHLYAVKLEVSDADVDQGLPVERDDLRAVDPFSTDPFWFSDRVRGCACGGQPLRGGQGETAGCDCGGVCGDDPSGREESQG